MLLCKEDKSCKMTYNILLTIQAQGPYGKLQNKFFPQRYMTQEWGGWAIQVEKGGSVTYSMDRENEVSKIFVIFLGSNRVRKISIQTNFWI